MKKKTIPVPSHLLSSGLSRAAQSLYVELLALKDWTQFVPSAPDLVLLIELRALGWIVGDKLKTPAPAKEQNPRHAQFIDLWTVAYQKQFGYVYAFNGWKDGKSVRELLGYGTNDELLDLAHRAWTAPKDKQHWACAQAVTLYGFQGQWNRIRAELSGSVRNGEHLKGKIV